MNKKDKNLEKFKEKLRFKGYAESSIGTYSYFLRLFLEFTNKPLTHIFKKDAYLFIEECSEMNHSQKNQVLSSLKLFYRFVLNVELNYIKTERPRKIKKLPMVIDWQKLEKQFEKIDNLKHRAILELACRCALRVSEVCNLKMNDIDSERMMILIRDSKGNKDRYVPISESLLELLRKYYKSYRPESFLFNGQFGLKYSTSSCQRIFKKHIDSSKSFHTCRHSGATKMLDNGTNLRVIQSILGHKSSTTTEIYTHVSTNTLQEAVL